MRKCNWRAALVQPAFIFLCAFECAAQQSDKWLALSFVTEFRITPLYTNATTSVFNGVPGRYYSQDKQTSGPSFGLDIRKNLYAHWLELAFGLRSKYGHLMYEGPPTIGLNRSIKVITVDYLFSIVGRISVGKEREVRLSLGHGFMNRGSEYMTSQVDSLGNGTYIITSQTGDFHFGADFATLSFNVRRLELGLAAYRVTKSNYDNLSDFLLLTPFLKYDIWRTGRKPKVVPSD